MRTLIILTLAALAVSGCENENEARLRKITESQTDETIKREQAALNERVTLMESSLRSRTEEFETLSGTFEGATAGKDSPYRIKIVSAVNQPLYKAERVRTPSEVEEDLKTLGLNIHVVVFDPQFSKNAVSCRLEGVRPDPATKEVTVIREACPNAFKFVFGANEVQGVLMPSTTAEEISFTATRVEK